MTEGVVVRRGGGGRAEYRSFHRCYRAASIGGQREGARGNGTGYDIAQSISEKIGSDL